ncbi:ergosterol biosynthesis ERG4/ERG24 family-domain-containing protein [Lophiotrema nucula]|uniref:Delta(24(24(1)))-sterol reductase n=1 Tax=Lophiotrema nucula TaxID=690887 RepID=A0A6A5YVK6_9PLEO|nr:ergosterol biosynthesis ERG4/ERG24 family-domain-containing protein [Lophiotrema nucula]
MSERITRSKTGTSARMPRDPGFVETPGRKKYTRKSIIPTSDGSDDGTPEPMAHITDLNASLSALKGGDLNGNANGNGSANGHSNGAANGSTAIRKRATTNPKENFGPVDLSGKFDFGGSWGVGAMMVGFPTLMYYMWIGAIFYDGKAPTPAANESWSDFFTNLGYLVKTEAYPSNKAWQIYWFFGLVQMAFYMLLPGVYRKGKALPHMNMQQMPYYCSGMWSMYTSIVLSLILHFTGIFKLYTLIDMFGPIMSVAILSGFLCASIAYISAWVRGARIRMTGYPVYDFFMGSELNPRLFGILDFKMFLEVRIPWYILLFLSLGTCLRQYELYGYVSGEAIFLLLAMYLYAGACSKGEHLIITTWDMYYEKLGFMLIFWNMAGVPLSYCHCILYIASHHPEEYHWPTWFIGGLIVAYLCVYYVWDTCNSQKNQFRQEERGITEERTTFPYFKYGRIANPTTIETKHGNKIFADGWYAKARKIHYTCDLFFALSWGLITGFSSPFPWFYPLFFSCMIIHRTIRDDEKCQERYGEAWTEYRRRVPYIFLPYVY